MNPTFRKLITFVGDWISLYLALLLMIRISYGQEWLADWYNHLRPYSLIFPIWLITLYATYLYEARFLRFGIDTLRTIGVAVAISFVASVTAFYAFPPGLIHPRRDIILFAPMFALVLTLWRWGLYKVLGGSVRTSLIFLGGGKEVRELQQCFRERPQLGYISQGVVQPRGDYLKLLREKIDAKGARLIVVDAPAGKPAFTRNLFSLLSGSATIIDLEEFYERIFNRVSPAILTDTWFIRNLESISLGMYQLTKRISDILFALAGLIITLPLYPFLGLAIKLDSKGPVFFRQERVGKDNSIYQVYKFRTMRVLGPGGSAETGGPIYARPGDKRITRLGKFLRATHIDELPQLWNVLKGDMSLVGPRPIRPEFVEKLSSRIPYYNMRHLVKPGLTGWAQINCGYGITIKEEYTKLQYDIYYTKKQSLVLDIAIVLKTIKSVLVRGGQ